jgi:Ca2+:H+ antiporter
VSAPGTERDGLSTTERTRGGPARESGAGARENRGSGLSRLELILLGAVALVTALAGVARYTGFVSNVAAFVLAGLGLAGGAWIVSLATEQLGQRSGPAVAGFSQSTLGNLPEFFVVLFALQAGQHIVAQTAIIGSILVNALLVLGLVIVAGARRARDGVMRFSPRLPNDTATLLLLAVFIIVLIGLVVAANDPASHHVQTISIVGAIAILLVYGSWLRQYLRSDQDEPRQAPRLSLITTIVLLAAAGTQSAFVSDWFVHALQPAIHTLHISQTFAGLVIVAIAGNAVENTTGIVLAAKGQSELAISVVKNSVAQIAAFLYPVLVLVSLLTAISLTFALAPVFIGALFGTAVIVWQITGDGEATVFEGLALVAVFVILAAVAAFET